MSLFFLLNFLVFSKNCTDLDYWYLNCTFPIVSSTRYSVTCPKSGFYEYSCVPIEGVVCTGSSIVNKSILCYPTEGKDPSTALVLSVLLGFLGVDRFYLGYPTIGLFKLFTGGFFGLGWYIDIFLIALRIVKPARGGVYKFLPGANFRIRLPGSVWL